MPEKKESARTTVVLAVCTVAVGFYVLAFGLQTLICIEAHRWAFSSPFLNAVPRPIPTTIATPAQERNLELFGISFQAPWKGVAKKTEGEARSVIQFQSGPVLIFFNPENEEDLVAKIRNGDPNVYTRYQAIFGTRFFPDDYSMYAAVYEAAPNQVWPFTPRSRAIRINTLLLWKLRFGSNGAGSIYSVQTGNLQGLQFGDPSQDRSVLVHLFDNEKRQLRLMISSRSGQPGTIPEADINCVIYSIKSLSPSR